jgi:hypothetical protein
VAQTIDVSIDDVIDAGMIKKEILVNPNLQIHREKDDI